MIQYRAWLTEEKKMVKVSSIDLDKKGIYVNISKKKTSDNAGLTYFKDDKYILMQKTLATDKTGKEIYEGDIVELSLTGKVVNGGDVEYTHIAPLKEHVLTIIGNIYENPELVKTPKPDGKK